MRHLITNLLMVGDKGEAKTKSPVKGKGDNDALQYKVSIESSSIVLVRLLDLGTMREPITYVDTSYHFTTIRHIRTFKYLPQQKANVALNEYWYILQNTTDLLVEEFDMTLRD